MPTCVAKKISEQVYSLNRQFIYPDIFRLDDDTYAVAVIPYVVGVHIEVVSLVRTDGQVVVVTLIEDEMHFAR